MTGGYWNESFTRGSCIRVDFQDDAASGHSGHVLSYLGGLSGSDEEVAMPAMKTPGDHWRDETKSFPGITAQPSRALQWK